jgi:hypothetical protein
MARKSNSLFIGAHQINIDGPNVKHPALIAHWGTVNVGKIGKEPIELIGLDIETNSETGKMMLLGEWMNNRYHATTDNFLARIEALVRYAISNKMNMAYWSKLDPFVIFREFLENMDPELTSRTLDRFGTVGGEWDRKEHKWKVEPVAVVQGKGYTFGIQGVIRSAIQFFHMKDEDESPKTVWAFDIKGLYQKGLEKEAKSRFKWYSKIDESAHIIDWDRFWVDEYYHDMVLESNKLDARAAAALGLSIQEDFHKAFKWYPRTLISQGSLARAAVAAVTWNRHAKDETDEKAIKKLVAADLSSIGIINHEERWADQFGKEVVKDIYAMASEAYSGGNIEAYGYGFSESVSYADIASAYPGVIVGLKDLRGSVIVKGKGVPEKKENSYTFIRGTISIPAGMDYNPITIKHPIFKGTNIRPTGIFKASYIIEEREFMESRGATFTDESWIRIETRGEPSPLALATQEFVDLRAVLIEMMDSAQFMAKIAANSVYGITYEAVPIHEDALVKMNIKGERDDYYRELLRPYLKKLDLSGIQSDLKYHFGKDWSKIASRWQGPDGVAPDIVADELAEEGLWIEETHGAAIVMEMDRLWNLDRRTQDETVDVWEVIPKGYRAGEFYNPIYAAYITGLVRIQLNKACEAISNAGGVPILTMTDSIFWKGTPDMLPSHMWREKKTLGFFEKPETAKNFICLGSGRYGYVDKKGYTQTKRRGINVRDFKDADGIALDEFNWMELAKIADKNKSTTVELTVSVLISPGLIKASRELSISDLGRVVKRKRELGLTVGHTKRIASVEKLTGNKLMRTMTMTNPVHLDEAMLGYVVDGTYPNLRSNMESMELVTAVEKKRESTRERQRRYYNSKGKQRYQSLIDSGFGAKEASKLKYLSDESLRLYIQQKGDMS